MRILTTVIRVSSAVRPLQIAGNRCLKVVNPLQRCRMLHSFLDYSDNRRTIDRKPEPVLLARCLSYNSRITRTIDSPQSSNSSTLSYLGTAAAQDTRCLRIDKLFASSTTNNNEHKEKDTKRKKTDRMKPSIIRQPIQWSMYMLQEGPRILKMYGPIAAITYSTVWASTLAGFYLLTARGVDVMTIFNAVGLGSIGNRMEGEASNFLLAYTATTLTGPVRMALCIFITPGIHRATWPTIKPHFLRAQRLCYGPEENTTKRLHEHKHKKNTRSHSHTR
ncbi:hypothetical protein SARC_05486 [Sphaeroforma arctica JP610]|uniref:DUF1279 domain-containing protein n=1 Tax=Sphaeroforma arctica JP610 TaxID=667725 RepID=A0A0L0G043_9EUKA|nr:hypothetical protein SARC_05486 [Sphaeroforma arctica JP610]KNC82219.1 hypothetical protein SARC_05486 [Sphaeroforma arctica JP610]|eukprot:XP_014156121.1 hypothetical protein SARC_05486 [Sphaeroforma arctica JP610]